MKAKTVLVIDDDEMNLQITKMILEKNWLAMYLPPITDLTG